MTAFNYLARQSAYRLKQFLLHWYSHGYFIFGGRALKTLERLDRVFALKVTWRYFGQPLFKDFTYIGYFLGLIFRASRILVSVIIYALVASIFIAGYLIWALIPAYLLLGIITA